jgi:hypothetical protein
MWLAGSASRRNSERRNRKMLKRRVLHQFIGAALAFCVGAVHALTDPLPHLSRRNLSTASL